MKLPFTKMHGLGNDFVVFDFTEKVTPISQAQAAHIADRHFGIGCDQILIVERSFRPEMDFKYRILNSDGGEVEQCGNGARCFAVYVRERGLSDKSKIKVETLGGDIILEVDDTTGNVIVDMGVPEFSPGKIPIMAKTQSPIYSVLIDNQPVVFSAVSIGNPHAVIRVADVDVAQVRHLGAALESHEFFPQRANIGFMQILDRRNICLRVFERGVGETIACGTGACAAVATGIALGDLDQTVSVQLPGGDLSISWRGGVHSLIMKGPTQTVFSGEFELQ
ncbi:MAG: diaminopimelate epimerase [Polaribacter sp.]|jgi:diaminopimelate epimerase